MRAHKTKKRANKAPKDILLFGFWGDKIRWSRAERPPRPTTDRIRRNMGLSSAGLDGRQNTPDASWAVDEA